MEHEKDITSECVLKAVLKKHDMEDDKAVAMAKEIIDRLLDLSQYLLSIEVMKKDRNLLMPEGLKELLCGKDGDGKEVGMKYEEIITSECVLKAILKKHGMEDDKVVAVAKEIIDRLSELYYYTLSIAIMKKDRNLLLSEGLKELIYGKNDDASGAEDEDEKVQA